MEADSPLILSKAQQEANRVAKIMFTRGNNFKARNQRIRTRFNELHNDKRIRYDDVMTTLAMEFCLAQTTIMKALKSED